MSLTAKKVARLMRSGEPSRNRGLYLIVANKAGAHWELGYQLHGRSRWLGLGSARTFELDEARERAKRERQKLADKIDPLDIRRVERAKQAAANANIKTFRECADDYIAAHRVGWRSPKHGGQWINTLSTYVHPLIGDLDVAAIDTPCVLRVLEQQVTTSQGNPGGPFWIARAVTAERVRSRIELILAWAAARGHRPQGDNPARGKGHINQILVAPAKNKLARVVPHRAVPYAELPGLMAELRRHNGVAARRGEVIGAKWDEVDLADATWTIPAGRMKRDREHRVPLGPSAIDLLKSLYVEDGNPYLFIGAQQERLSNAAMIQRLRRLGRSETVHGFRSSFSDWAHESTAFSNHAIELSLAHSIG
jgi:integrase